MKRKQWWKSKTLWANAIALVGAAVAKFTGVEMDAEAAVGFLAVANWILRVTTTSGLEA